MEVSEVVSQRILDAAANDPGNKVCVDCDRTRPEWSSTNHGVFLCLYCAGKHRSLGRDVSAVRSTTLDHWKAEDLERIRTGGNGRLKAFFAACGVPPDCPVEDKYRSNVAEAYRRLLRGELAEAEARAVRYVAPPALPRLPAAAPAAPAPRPHGSKHGSSARPRRGLWARLFCCGGVSGAVKESEGLPSNPASASTSASNLADGRMEADFAPLVFVEGPGMHPKVTLDDMHKGILPPDLQRRRRRI
eukprot:tig00000881_g5219.t1